MDDTFKIIENILLIIVGIILLAMISLTGFIIYTVPRYDEIRTEEITTNTIIQTNYNYDYSLLRGKK